MCAAASFTVHHFLNPAEEQTQILSFSRQALVKKFFPDYTRLTSLADELPNGNEKKKAMHLLGRVSLKVRNYSTLKARAKAAVSRHLYYELGVAKNMQIEKKSHDAIPQLQDQLAKAKYQLATVQTKLRHEQMAVGGLIAPQKLLARSKKGRAVEMSLDQVAAPPKPKLSRSMQKAVAMAKQAEAERFKPELDQEAKRRRNFKAAESKLLQTQQTLRRSRQAKTYDGKMLQTVTDRIKNLQKAATSSLHQAKMSFREADTIVRKAQNKQAFKVGAKLLKTSKKVPTSKDIMHDLMK